MYFLRNTTRYREPCYSIGEQLQQLVFKFFAKMIRMLLIHLNWFSLLQFLIDQQNRALDTTTFTLLYFTALYVYQWGNTKNISSSFLHKTRSLPGKSLCCHKSRGAQQQAYLQHEKSIGHCKCISGCLKYSDFN